MPPYARGGGPIARPGTADGTRGGPYPRGRGMGPGPGRGMPPRGGPAGGRPGQYPQGDYGGKDFESLRRLYTSEENPLSSNLCVVSQADDRLRIADMADSSKINSWLAKCPAWI